MPPGLRKGNTLRYRIGTAAKDGTDATRSVGVAAPSSGGFTIKLGSMSHGVHVVALKLVAPDGTLVAERPREPFVVLERKAMKTVVPTSIRDGLELELEKTIDLTTPSSGPPWVEGAPAHRAPR